MKIEIISAVSYMAGVAAIGYAFGIRRKCMTICDKIDRSTDSIIEASEVEISEDIVRKAVERSARREAEKAVETACKKVLRDIELSISKEIKMSIDENYADIRKSVENKLSEEVSKIDISILKKEVREAAKEKIEKKFENNLDDILAEFNGRLESISKIYKSILNTLQGSERNKEMTFKIG